MHKHSTRIPDTDSIRDVTYVDDWDARNRLSEALEQLVDEAARDAEDIVGYAYAHRMGRHSSGTIDYGAELEALRDWFGIE